MPVTSAQVRMARAALNWTVRDLAEAAGLHRNTVTNLEIGRYAGDPQTLAIIEQVLTKAGIDFIEENGGGPGVRLRKRQRPKPPK
jgi:transcriptional regulator with XRE-family HTH domain